MAAETPASCQKCGTSLPAGSKFCLKCGYAVKAAQVSVAARGEASNAAAACPKCKAKLPAGSDFCPECGIAHPTIKSEPPRKMEPARPRIVLWVSLFIAAAMMCWAGISDDPLALRLKALVNRAHEQSVTSSSFEVKKRSFVSYRLDVPTAVTHVNVGGDFSVSGDVNQDVEVQLMSAEGFVSWQDGYSAEMFYDSGKVKQGKVEATLPATAGTYYLVFDNRYSAKTAKSVQADITLRYDRWWPPY